MDTDKPVMYLCGPINGCTDAEAKDWRNHVKMAAPMFYHLDPMVRDYRGKEDECFREIVELDKGDIDVSDILLVNYDRPSVGTSMEILYAWEQQTPVVVVAKEGERISPWLRYHATKITHSFAEAIRWIREHFEC